MASSHGTKAVGQYVTFDQFREVFIQPPIRTIHKRFSIQKTIPGHSNKPANDPRPDILEIAENACCEIAPDPMRMGVSVYIHFYIEWRKIELVEHINDTKISVDFVRDKLIKKIYYELTSAYCLENGSDRTIRDYESGIHWATMRWKDFSGIGLEESTAPTTSR